MKILLLLPLVVGLTSCAIETATVPLTPEAEKLLVVDNTENCKIIDVITGAHSFGKEIGKDVQFALNEAKNKAARLGANAIKIVGPKDVSNKVGMSSRGGSVIVEALDCD